MNSYNWHSKTTFVHLIHYINIDRYFWVKLVSWRSVYETKMLSIEEIEANYDFFLVRKRKFVE